MINPEKYLYLSEHVREIGRSYSWQEAQIKVGHVLADLWLAERHGHVDFWGVDDYGELMFMTFLYRVYEVDKTLGLDLEDVKQIKWYFNCGTFDLGLPPGFKQRIWIKNALSYKHIEIPEPSGFAQTRYPMSCLVMGKRDTQEMESIYEGIVVKENVIRNSEEITGRLRMFYRGLLDRSLEEIEVVLREK